MFKKAPGNNWKKTNASQRQKRGWREPRQWSKEPRPPLGNRNNEIERKKRARDEREREGRAAAALKLTRAHISPVRVSVWGAVDSPRGREENRDKWMGGATAEAAREWEAVTAIVV